MNRDQLKEALEKAHVPETSYNLTGQGALDNRYVMEQNANEWTVYYFERGKKHAIKTFSTEDGACAYLSEKLLAFSNNTMRPLPLGTVVKLRGGKLKLMVVSRALRVPGKNNQVYYFDYGAVAYPNGLVTTDMAYFQQDAVGEVLHWGYSDEDDLKVLDSIHHYIDTHPNMKRGSAENCE